MAAALGAALGAGFSLYGSSFAKPTDALTFDSKFTGPGADPLATETRRFLMKRLRTTGMDSELFPLLQGSARGQIHRQGNTARQRLADALGSRNKGLLARSESEIARGEMEATASATAEILIGLEGLRDQGIFEFLSIEAQESLGIHQLRQAEEGRRQRAQLTQAQMIGGAFSGGLGGGGGGGSTFGVV